MHIHPCHEGKLIKFVTFTKHMSTMTDHKTLGITEDVSWIGILDQDIITFDIVMETTHGTTYNSYFIDAEKKTLVDTAKESFRDVYLDKVRQVVNPKDISYIVVTHTEPDHSGCLKYLIELAPDAVVYGSRQAITYLQGMMNLPFRSQFVKDGDVLDLGNKKLRFIGTPNLHWPDTMYAYLEEEGLLFTCDSFGSHFCEEAMFDDEVPPFDDSFTYYFNVILRPFSHFMLKAIEKIRPLDIRMVLPGHGPILRSTWKEKVAMAEKYAEDYIANSMCSDNAILLAYISAYGYTKQMAEAIAEGISQVVNFRINLVDIEKIELGDLEELIVCSKFILIGSPTINQNTLLPVYKMFSVINPVRDRGKMAAVFGSFGWSGEAVKLIESNLRALKLNVVQEGISVRFSPDKEKYKELVAFGKSFATLINSPEG